MKTLPTSSLGVFLIVLAACGPSAQEKKERSPECVAAKNEAAQRRESVRSLDAEIKLRDEENRRKLDRLRMEDQLAQAQGRPTKNRRAEVLIENAIDIDEVGLRHSIDSSPEDEVLIKLACEAPDARR